MGWQEVSAPWILEGSLDRIAFEAYVRSQLLPTLRRGDIVVMDNLSAHTEHAICQLGTLGIPAALFVGLQPD